MAEFQRGESSEARNYLKKSRHFAAKINERMFHVTSERFVANENLHAGLLLRFMQRSGIPARQTSPRDRVFRWLRSLGDLGWSSRVILVAELIAQEYYPCLKASTRHPILIRICDRVISEEAAHIRFQVERIVRVEASLHGVIIKLRDVVQTILMTCTACAVYVGHCRVLAARFRIAEFLTHAQARNRRAIANMASVRRMAAVPRGARPGQLPASC